MADRDIFVTDQDDDPGHSAEEQRRESTVDDDSANEETASSEQNNLQVQLDHAKGDVLRAKADLENYRQRVTRERELDRRYANIGLLRDLLPVLDNIQRAISAAEENEDSTGLLEGIKLVAKQMEEVFSQHNCTQIDPAGAPFDPNLHEAISHMPSPDHPSGTIISVASPGYQLVDRVVRPAQVVVSSGKPEPDDG